jgi:hypothetical protein
MSRSLAPRASLTAILIVASLSLGCEVSVFGSEPVQILGGPGPAPGGESGSCGEPEETRRARERLADGEPASGETSPCAYHCVLEGGALTDESRGTCSLATLDEGGVVHLDMSRSDAIVARIEVCAATVAQLADSSSSRSDGADDPTSGHDASVVLHDGALDLYPAHDGGLSPSHVEGYVSAAEGADACTTRTLELTDSVVYLHDLERGLCGTSMLRIDPPTDAQGTPDSLWHLALGRTLDGARTGAPPPRLDLCFL